MASPETLGLLCAGSVMFHSGGGSSSGNQLSRSELAGLLRGLPEIAMNLALAKWMLDLDAERNLIAQVRVYTAGLAVNNGWTVTKGRPTISNMAAVAVFEVVRPNQCKMCDGAKFVRSRVCSHCHGSGIATLSGRSVATALGVDEAIYRRLWRDRYYRVYQTVQDIDTDVGLALRRAEREPMAAVA